MLPKSISISFTNNDKSISAQKTLKTRNQEMSDKLRNRFQKKVLELRAYIIGLGGFGVSIYLLEF